MVFKSDPSKAKQPWWLDKHRSHLDQLVPRTIDELLALLAANYLTFPDTVRPQLAEALRWFREHVPLNVLATSASPHPSMAYAWRVRGSHTNLMAWLQSIAWTSQKPEELKPLTLATDTRLVTFRLPSMPQSPRPSGSFFAPGLTKSPDRLGINKPSPGAGRQQQTTPSHWIVAQPCQALRSRVADTLVHWHARSSPGTPGTEEESWYAQGGGLQLFIWDARTKIKKA